MTTTLPTAVAVSGTRLDDAVALVTGAGRGLGRGIALGLAQAGADVVLVSRSRAELETVAEEVGRLGVLARTEVCDVTDPDRVKRLVERLGPVDVLVNNAGTNAPEPFVDVLPETFDRLFAVNVRAAFFVAQAVARRLLEERRPGTIINVSSQMGHVGAPRRTVYCATKHAIEGLTKSMAVELAPHGIRVNAIAPTYVETPMTEPYFTAPEARRAAEGRIPLGRLGQVEDVVGAAVFLASPAASLITGTSLLIDGGYTAQ
jgi:NAD(P)-dependent dehydrogenase (short-subunit alcohol dehydrogenase family)